MQKSIYVKEEDEEIFKQAQELSDKDSLSATIVEALEEYNVRRRAHGEKLRQISLDVGTIGRNTDSTELHKITFFGRKLVERELDTSPDPDFPEASVYQLYQGQTGKFLLYYQFFNYGDKEIPDPKKEIIKADYQIVEHLVHLEGKDIPGLPEDMIEEAEEKLEEDYYKVKELNI